MTTIIVKGANYAGGKLQYYEAPIADLTVCSWLGLDNIYNRNFGTLGGTNTVVGSPVKQDELFRRFDLNNYLITPTYRKPITSMFAVFRDVSPLPVVQDFGFMISSERDAMNGANYNGGRRGITFARGYAIGGSSYQIVTSIHGDNAGIDYAVSSSVVANQNVLTQAATFSESSASGTGGARAKTYRFTDVAANGTTTDTAVASTLDLADEASYPFLVGRSYRTAYNKPIDLAFIAIGERLWTAAEKQALYDSVKRRFTALGGTM